MDFRKILKLKTAVVTLLKGKEYGRPNFQYVRFLRIFLFCMLDFVFLRKARASKGASKHQFGTIYYSKHISFALWRGRTQGGGGR